MNVGEYRCQSLAAATTEITGDGFVVGTVTPEPPGYTAAADSLVVSQDPLPGKKLASGGAINLDRLRPGVVPLPLPVAVSLAPGRGQPSTSTQNRVGWSLASGPVSAPPVENGCSSGATSTATASAISAIGATQQGRISSPASGLRPRSRPQ